MLIVNIIPQGPGARAVLPLRLATRYDDPHSVRRTMTAGLTKKPLG